LIALFLKWWEGLTERELDKTHLECKQRYELNYSCDSSSLSFLNESWLLRFHNAMRKIWSIIVYIWVVEAKKLKMKASKNLLKSVCFMQLKNARRNNNVR
jgi:hypothetical protein